MNDARIQQLKSEANALDANCERIFSDAKDAGRALTADERDRLDGYVDRMRSITDDITRIKGRGGAFAANANVNRAIGLGADGPNVDTDALGEWLALRGKAALGGVGNEKYRAEAAELGRALQHGVSGDGISPVTIEGDLVKFVDSNRYAVNAARRIPMPQNQSQTFKRPRLTQSTQVGTQASQGDVLASRRLTTTGDTITKQTEGGTLALSEQEIDWTDPAMLGLAVEDLAEQYAIDTDTVLTAAIATAAAAAANPTTLALDAGPADFIAAIATSKAAVYSTSKKLPDTLYVGTNRFAYLDGLTDNNGRPLFADIGAQNAPGAVSGFAGVVKGLRLVVDPNFDPDTMVVAASQLVEWYEQDKGLLNVNAPSTLEVIYAYRGYVATNIYSAGLNKLAP